MRKQYQYIEKDTYEQSRDYLLVEASKNKIMFCYWQLGHYYLRLYIELFFLINKIANLCDCVNESESFKV